MSDLTEADQLADVFASFAVSKNPTGLSLGIDSAYELGDHIASTWLAEHDAKVRAEEREKAAQIAERSASSRSSRVRQFAADEIAARIREQDNLRGEVRDVDHPH